MNEQTFQKFKLAVDTFSDYCTNIEAQEEYKLLTSKLESGEISETNFNYEFEKMIVEKFKMVPEQFTKEELIELYDNFTELVSKTDKQRMELFNTIFVPVIEKNYPQFFKDYWNNHDPQAREYNMTRLFHLTKKHITTERIEELLLIYKEKSSVFNIARMLQDITITNRIINFIFDNNIDIYLSDNAYNSMVVQMPNVIFEQKIEYLQRRKQNDSENYALLFSSILSIVPEDYTLDQILDLPLIKERLIENKDYINLLCFYKFKNVDEFIEDLTRLDLINKFNKFEFARLLSQQKFSKEEFIQMFLSKKLPYSLRDFTGKEMSGVGLYVFNQYSLTEILEILNNKEIFPGELEMPLVVDLIKLKRVNNNIIEILNNPVLCKAFCSNFLDFSRDLQESIASLKGSSLGTSTEELTTQLLEVFDKENFTMALSKYSSIKFTIDEKYERFLQLANEIPELMSSFNFTIFRDEIFGLGYDFAKLLSLYPSISSDFAFMVERSENSSASVKFSRVLPKIWQTIEKECQELGLDQREILANVLSYSKLADFEFEGIENVDISKLIYYLQMFNTRSNISFAPRITNLVGIENYEINLANMCNEKYKDATTLEEKINIYFNKYFNINRNEAMEIYNMFATSREMLPEELATYINKIIFALNITNISVIDELYATEKNYTLKESYIAIKKIKQFCSSSLRQGIDENNPLNSPVNEMSYNGKTLRIHHPIENFCMLVNSTDAYGKLELLNNNYYDSWNKSSRVRNHGICCSYVAHDNLGIAEVRDILIGFTNWSDGAVPNMAPYDLYTANDGAVITAARQNKFLTYRDLINNTRHTHNEISLERYQDIPGAKHGKIQPSYIIIFEDMPEELKQKAYKAAVEFGQGEPLPIICLNKKLIAEREKQKLDKMIEEFRQTGDLGLLSEILCKHENNRSGYRITNPEFLEGENAFFPSDKIVNLFSEMFNYYMNEWQNGKITTEDYWQKTSQILEILEAEEEKFAITNETGHRTNNIDLPVIDWRNQIMESLSQILDVPLSNRTQTIQQIVLSETRDDEIFRNFQTVNTDELLNLLDIVQKQGVYGELGKNHDLSHIERVLLFADMLARKENLSAQERNLLLLSAAYHDCGRENDRVDKKHGERSAKKITPLLENFTEEEQGIIKVSIEFHEEDVDFILSNLCMKYNLSQEAAEVAKKLAKLLKDADALDRTRFRNAATLDPERLSTASAKGMVEFAKKLQKLYKDLPTYLIEQTLSDEMHYVNT